MPGTNRRQHLEWTDPRTGSKITSRKSSAFEPSRWSAHAMTRRELWTNAVVPSAANKLSFVGLIQRRGRGGPDAVAMGAEGDAPRLVYKSLMGYANQ